MLGPALKAYMRACGSPGSSPGRSLATYLLLYMISMHAYKEGRNAGTRKGKKKGSMALPASRIVVVVSGLVMMMMMMACLLAPAGAAECMDLCLHDCAVQGKSADKGKNLTEEQCQYACNFGCPFGAAQHAVSNAPAVARNGGNTVHVLIHVLAVAATMCL
ncbi:hypothetical protein ACQJBY_067412 [Aegilops geniculata]